MRRVRNDQKIPKPPPRSEIDAITIGNDKLRIVNTSEITPIVAIVTPMRIQKPSEDAGRSAMMSAVTVHASASMPTTHSRSG